MRDTGFTVPAAKRDRRAGLCGFDDEGRLTALAATPGGHALAERPDDMTFESGGQGLWSTLDDYLAFARMLSATAPSTRRLLRPRRCALMTSNQLTPAQRADARMLGRPVFAARPWLRHGRRGRHGAGAGRSAAVPRRRRHGRLAGRLWRLVAGRSDRPIGADLPGAQHAGAAQMAEGIGLGVWSAIAGFHAACSAP